MYSIASSVGSPARRSPVAIVRTLDNSLRQGCLSSSPRPPVCLWSRTCARRGDVCAPLANGTSRAGDIPILLWHYEWCSGTSGLVRALVPVDVREGPDDPAGGARRRVSSGSRRAHAQAARTRYLVPAGRSGTCASGHNIVGPCPSLVRARASVEPPRPPARIRRTRSASERHVGARHVRVFFSSSSGPTVAETHVNVLCEGATQGDGGRRRARVGRKDRLVVRDEGGVLVRVEVEAFLDPHWHHVCFRLVIGAIQERS